MQLRVARHTDRLDEVVAFYRDGVGLKEIGGFRGHLGYDGVFLALPGSDMHLEFTTGGEHGAPVTHPESLLVFYLGSTEAVEMIARRLASDPVVPANPYWAEHGLTFEDPEGFRVVLVPAHWEGPDPATVNVAEYTGSRTGLRRLFELAEDSTLELDDYIEQGRVLTAVDGELTVGHLQLVDTEEPGTAEIKNMAVDEARQGRGVGRALVAGAISLAAEGRTRLVVATGAADTGNLRFYQRLGFRLRSVERDAFTPATGYEPGLRVDGVELRDRVWLDLDLSE